MESLMLYYWAFCVVVFTLTICAIKIHDGRVSARGVRETLFASLTPMVNIALFVFALATVLPKVFGGALKKQGR